MPYSNSLTEAETERLAYLAEELAEAVVAVGKILRHGYTSYDPTKKPFERVLNRRSLELEIGDVQAAIARMHTANDIDIRTTTERALLKLRDNTYFHHQENDDAH